LVSVPKLVLVAEIRIVNVDTGLDVDVGLDGDLGR